MFLAMQTPIQFLSWAETQLPCLTTKLSNLSVNCPTSIPFKTTPMMMGCPRICPGGVTKRKWRTMQAKKAKKLHQAGLVREQQIYRKRKQAERRAAVVELERPWETLETKQPNLLSASADEPLEDWFQHELISPDSGVPSASRLFSGGVSHSVYGQIGKISEEFQSPCLEEDSHPDPINRSVRKLGLQINGGYKNSRSSGSVSDKGGSRTGFRSRGKAKKGENEKSMESLGSKEVGYLPK